LHSENGCTTTASELRQELATWVIDNKNELYVAGLTVSEHVTLLICHEKPNSYTQNSSCNNNPHPNHNNTNIDQVRDETGCTVEVYASKMAVHSGEHAHWGGQMDIVACARLIAVQGE
jgi:hypothetical protein